MDIKNSNKHLSIDRFFSIDKKFLMVSIVYTKFFLFVKISCSFIYKRHKITNGFEIYFMYRKFLSSSSYDEYITMIFNNKLGRKDFFIRKNACFILEIIKPDTRGELK